jgi:hypothetical protein
VWIRAFWAPDPVVSSTDVPGAGDPLRALLRDIHLLAPDQLSAVVAAHGR